MPKVIETDEQGNIAIRLYMTVNRQSFPELVSCLEGLPRREQNRLVKALILRGLLAERNAPTAVTAATLPAAVKRPPLTAVASPLDGEGSTLVDGLSSAELDEMMRFGSGELAITNP